MEPKDPTLANILDKSLVSLEALFMSLFSKFTVKEVDQSFLCE